jgi:hypothetical protein
VTDDEDLARKELQKKLEAIKISEDELDELLASVSSTGARIPRLKPTYSQIELIPIDSIKIRERQRGGKIDGRGEGETIKDLEDSFEAVGFFSSILVCKLAPSHLERFAHLEGTLVFGFRRMEAVKGKGDTEILAQFVTPHPDDPNPEATLQSVELFEDIKRLNRDPLNVMHSRAKIAAMYDKQGMLQKDIAEILSISESYLSNTIRDAEFASEYPQKVTHAKTQEHIKDAREKHDKALRQAEQERLFGSLVLDKNYEILTDDFNLWAPAHSGPLFNLGYIDFPYGIGQDKFGQKSRTDETYDDSPEVAEQLWRTLEENVDRLFTKDAHLIVSFSMTQYEEVKARLQRMGWPNPIPFAWVKLSAGIIPRPGRDLRQCWEPIFICERGGDRKVEGKQNWFAGDPPRGGEREHQSQKNEAMMQHLLGAFVDEDTRLLDPTCGSGVAIRVAKRLKAAHALGLEKSEQNALLARAALGKVKRGELLKVNGTLEDLGL